jgi:ubiquinone/menaquinone biosynthesis C-methylase UbiE
MSTFDAKAASWDTPDRIERAQAWAEALLATTSLGQTASIVEFGAGTGLLTLALAPRVKEVFALDSSEGMLARLLEKQQAQGVTNVRTARVDVEETWHVPAASYDCLVSCLTLHHLKSPQDYARTAFETLRPGGFAVVIDLDSEGGEFHSSQPGVHHDGFVRGELGTIFTGAGFESPRFETLPGLRKRSRSGVERDFSLFMLVARKPAT